MTPGVGRIEPPPVTGKYKLGLVVAALSLVLLVAVYIGLILFAGYGVYYQVTHFFDVMRVASTNFFTFFVWLGLPFGGLAVIFFLIKPLLAAKAPEPDRYTLTSKSDPELFAVITKVCQLIDAPLPSRVDVDCQVNATVHFRKGWRSLKEHDVVLTIGLPLVSNLTMQEFVGVLAHEFGHFRQGAGMRLSYVVRALNRWFARVVYERDQWDIWLARAAYRIDIRFGIFFHVIRFCVWLSRRVLWVLMHVASLTGGFMLRQMEFDADSYEVKVAGSASFAETTKKLQRLSATSTWAHEKMKETWRSRKLPENVVRFIDASLKNIPPDLQKEIDEAVAKDKFRLFATHPCSAARIRAAETLNEPGIFHETEPAKKLINGFLDLCKGATRFHYASTLELRVKDENLVPNETSEGEGQSVAEGEAAYRKFFGNVTLKYRPILLSTEELASASAAELMQRIGHARQAMEQSVGEVLKANREYGEAEALYQRGFDAIKNESQTATERASAMMQNLAPTLALFEGHAQTRLVGSLLLLHHPEIAGRIADVEALRTEADQLTAVFMGIGAVFPTIQEMRRKSDAYTAALRARREKSLEKPAQARLNELEPELREMLKGLKQWLSEVPYPFHHSRTDMNLEEYVQLEVPAVYQSQGIGQNCAFHVIRLMPLYQRVLARLAVIALKVEEVIPATVAV